MNNVVRGLGVRVKFDEETKTIDIDATGKLGSETPYKYVSQIAPLLLFLVRFWHAMVMLRFLCQEVVQLVAVQLICT